MKTNSIIPVSLAEDQYYKLSNMAFVVLCSDKECQAIILKSFEVTEHNIKSLIEDSKKALKSIAVCKLIGPDFLIGKVKSYCEKLGLSNFKEVDRKGNFEILFNPSTGLLRATKGTSEVESSKASISEKKVENKPSARTSKPKKDIKVLVVDDSKTIRKLLTNILSKEKGITVVGTAEKPSEVEDLINELKPDVITLDIHMPEMTGVDLLKYIQPKYKTPTIMVTSISMEEGPLVLEALENGAFDYIQKPEMADIAEVAPILVDKVRAGANYEVEEKKLRATKNVGQFNQDSMVVIGSSTGGTNALKDILTKLPKDIPPMLIVQHIPAVFSKAFADRMNTLCPFEVKEAVDGDIVQANRVIIAEGGKQMKVVKDGPHYKIEINDDAPVNRFKPSVDYLFDSVVPLTKKKHIVGVILTGMGRDGAKGLLRLRDNGAYTIGQDEESCVVYGMPREAFDIGAVMYQEHKDDIAAKIGELSHPENVNGKAS